MIRVRGVYATALTKIFLDHGLPVTLPSETIAKRFNIPILTDPPLVTVKSDENDPQRIIVIGFQEPAERVIKILDRTLSYSGRIRSIVGIHSLVVGRVEKAIGDSYVIDFGRFKGRFRPGRRKITLPIGEKRVFRIISPPTNVNQQAIVDITPGIVGKYARLYKGDGIPSVSRHIKDEEKKRYLLELAKNLPRGYYVRRRSAAEYGKPSDLVAELAELQRKLEIILSKASEADVGDVIYEGEALAIYDVSTADRYKLDEIRNRVLPTVRMHHAWKTYEGDYSHAVDVLEKALELGAKREKIEAAMVEYALDHKSLKIIHRTPDGVEKKLKEGIIVYRDEKKIVLKRSFSGGGRYDGIDLPIERGDYALTHVPLGSRHVIHEYYTQDGKLKGIYANVNTPVELLPGAIRYTDLYIDVVRKPGEEARIIDFDELKMRKDVGLIPQELFNKALEEAEKLKELLDTRTPRCFLPRMLRSPRASRAWRVPS